MLRALLCAIAAAWAAPPPTGHSSVLLSAAGSTPVAAACPVCGHGTAGAVNCCSNGGSWEGECDDDGAHTWEEGQNACKPLPLLQIVERLKEELGVKGNIPEAIQAAEAAMGMESGEQQSLLEIEDSLRDLLPPGTSSTARSTPSTRPSGAAPPQRTTCKT